MTSEQEAVIRDSILEILTIEESEERNWEKIAQISDELILFIARNSIGDDVNNIWYQFLDDYDIRRNDDAYGSAQRAFLRRQM